MRETGKTISFKVSVNTLMSWETPTRVNFVMGFAKGRVSSRRDKVSSSSMMVSGCKMCEQDKARKLTSLEICKSILLADLFISIDFSNV